MMHEQKINHLLTGSIEGRVTINDLREKSFSDPDSLTAEEITAIRVFDAFRLDELRACSEEVFHETYLQLQVMANLMPYQEFLSDEYHKYT